MVHYTASDSGGFISAVGGPLMAGKRPVIAQYRPVPSFAPGN